VAADRGEGGAGRTRAEGEGWGCCKNGAVIKWRADRVQIWAEVENSGGVLWVERR